MKEKEPPKIEERLLKERRPFKLEEFAKEIGVGVVQVKRVLDKLKEEGYSFEQAGEYVFRPNAPKRGNIYRLLQKDRYMRFGVVSDTHLASKYERLDSLERMYDIFKKEGIKKVFHAGDITEGYGVYRGQEFEVLFLGQQEQIAYAVQNYPQREGIKTFFITGNHDTRQYERGGVDVGKQIEASRNDMVYLGQIQAVVQITDKIDMELLHPSGGVAYALSYKAQKDINNRPPNALPDILIYGQYHTAFYMHYRGIDFIQAPCFKDASLWEKSKGLNPVIGGWIVDVVINPDMEKIDAFKPELFVFEKKE